MVRDDDGTAAAFAQAYSARFGEHHLAWSLFFVAHLGDLRRSLGSLDDALLLAAMGLGPVALRARRSRADPATAATNPQRLAELTGIPRETVRRRLAAFRRKGWLEQGEDRAWRLAMGPGGRARIAEELAPLHGRFLAELARLQAAFARLAEDQKSRSA